MVKRKLITSIIIFLTLLSILLGPLNNSNLAFTKKETYVCGNNSRSINYDYWGNEVNLSAIDDNGTINPEIAVYKNNIHVIWEENYNIYYRRSVDYGINWSDVKVIASNKKYNATSPTLTIEAYNIYVAWVNVTFTYEELVGEIEDIDGEIYYRYSLGNGLGWSNDIEIVGDHTHFPRMAVKNNKIHLVWSKNYYGLTVDLYTWYYFDIYYMNFTISGSGTPTLLSQSYGSLYYIYGETPGLDIAIETKNIHIVWKDYKPYNATIRYINSTDNGASWSEIKNITYESGKSFKSTSIEVNGDNVYVSFIECIGFDRAVGFINSSNRGVTWNNYTIFDKNVKWDEGPDLTVANEKIFLVWTNNSQIYLKASFDYCQNWSENIKITNSSYSSFNPKVGVGDNYSHIVMLRDHSPIEVFYQNNYPIIEIKLIPFLDNRTAIEDLFYEQKYSSIGAPKSLINWTYQSNATWLNWGASNHTLFGIPSNDDVGQYWVRINISYNNELFDEHNFTLTVQNVNDPPEIIGAPNGLEVKAFEDYPLDLTDFVFDVDNNSNELSLMDNSNYTYIQDKTIIFNYTNSVSFEEVRINAWDGIDYSNDHIINVTVIPKDTVLPTIIEKSPDGDNVSISSNISIQFSKPMSLPSIGGAFSISPEVYEYDLWLINDTTVFCECITNLSYNQTYTVTISTSAKDLYGNPLDGNNNGVFEGSPIDDYSWTFTTIANKTQDENITPNRLPLIKINSPFNNSVFNLNDTIYFDCINTTDPDGDILEFLWVSNISGILSENSQFITNLPLGNHQITLYVNDGHGHNISESINVIVTPWNRPPLPIISSPQDNQKFNVTDIIHFDASNSTDPDNDYLFFSWHSNISGNLGLSSKLSTTLPAGHHVITLFVNDGFYHTVNRSINVYVLNGSGPSTNGNGHPLEPPGTESDSGTLGRVAIFSGIIAIIIIVILTAFVTTTEVGKYGFLGYVIPLYSRLKGKKVLDHETRGMIRGYIIANPGDHYNSIKRNLGLKNGSLTYHLKVLEREEIVKSERDGIFKRFYPRDERIPADIMHVTKIQESILNDIIDNPGITQKGLATNIGVSHQVVNYHVKKLVSANMVKTERLGKKTKYYPQEE